MIVLVTDGPATRAAVAILVRRDVSTISNTSISKVVKDDRCPPGCVDGNNGIPVVLTAGAMIARYGYCDYRYRSTHTIAFPNYG